MSLSPCFESDVYVTSQCDVIWCTKLTNSSANRNNYVVQSQYQISVASPCTSNGVISYSYFLYYYGDFVTCAQYSSGCRNRVIICLHCKVGTMILTPV